MSVLRRTGSVHAPVEASSRGAETVYKTMYWRVAPGLERSPLDPHLHCNTPDLWLILSN